MNKKVNILIFFIILILAIFLRVYKLSYLPPSLNWDEVSLGYNAYSMLLTGRDEWGESFPLSFRAFGDYKLPAYVYLDIPFIAIFGLNEWGVRLPSALLGIGLVLLIFLTLKNLTNSTAALWGALLAAILPWSITFSRISLEAQLALFLTTLGFYLFLKGLRQKYYLVLAGLSFGLTIFSYNSSRVVTPLLLIAVGFFWWKEFIKYKKIAFVSLLIFLLFFFIALPKAILADSSARYRWTTILDEGAVNRINELRQKSQLPEIFSKLIYNKVTYLVAEVPKNYLAHFSPNFLFINGGSNYQFSVPGSGLIYPVLAPFLLLGLYQILKDRKRWRLFIITWLLIAPIPAAITRDSPHALRSLMMIPPLIMITALGIEYCFNDLSHWIRRYRIVLSAIVVFILFGSLYVFWQNYTGSYSRHYSWVWQYGYKQAVEFIRNHQDEYGQVVFSKVYGEPHIYVLFYLQIDPAKYQRDRSLVRYHRSDWFWVDKLDKYQFINDWEIEENVKCQMSNVKCLLITSPGNYPANSTILESIDFLDGRGAFDIVAVR